MGWMEDYNTYYLKCLRSVYNELAASQRSANNPTLHSTSPLDSNEIYHSEKLALTSFSSFDSFLRQENF